MLIIFVHIHIRTLKHTNFLFCFFFIITKKKRSLVLWIALEYSTMILNMFSKIDYIFHIPTNVLKYSRNVWINFRMFRNVQECFGTLSNTFECFGKYKKVVFTSKACIR